ncbi:hypothetical protein LCGC14_0962180 [marine sediment metagenome]|uniref:PARP-type domain-containing protein n=1 Tax=marine sediment metagenome TaxID=412755 RepID=A0A0F9NE69_9ZZZZ
MNKDKIIKEFEESAGYRVCYWCNKSIERGKRILLSEEFERSNHFIGVRIIGAYCRKCFNKYNKDVRK